MPEPTAQNVGRWTCEVVLVAVAQDGQALRFAPREAQPRMTVWNARGGPWGEAAAPSHGARLLAGGDGRGVRGIIQPGNAGRS